MEKTTNELVKLVHKKKRNWVNLADVARFDSFEEAYDYSRKLTEHVTKSLRDNDKLNDEVFQTTSFGVETHVLKVDNEYKVSLTFLKKRGEVRFRRHEGNVKKHGGGYSPVMQRVTVK